MSINSSSDYQEPYVSLLQSDSLASEETKATKVTQQSPSDVEKPSRPYGIYLVGGALFAILCILVFQYGTKSNTYYFTYPELSDPKGQEIARTYYQNYYNDELWILTEQFKRSVDALNLDPNQKNLAIFDLDETLIDNYPIIDQMDFGWDNKKYDAWVESARAPKIEPVFAFLQYLLTKDISIAFITGRPESQRAATLQNLANYGLELGPDYISLHLRSSKEDHLPAAEFKLNRRRQLSEGYNIVACVGDQNSDCMGSFTGIPMKLPNYMYLIN